MRELELKSVIKVYAMEELSAEERHLEIGRAHV